MSADTADDAAATGAPVPSDHGPVHVAAVLHCINRVAAGCTPVTPSAGLLSDTLTSLGFSAADVAAIARLGIRDLYEQRRLAPRLTLGAAVVLHVAQRSEGMGLPDGVVLANVERVGARILGLAACSGRALVAGAAGPRRAAS